mmetsp:Transcript_26460/g.63769  ORF Transcript_26460/g.63769 Transcript_26460/m.63769 type:complete len:210 (+) Transcript_26460:1255-1884(+)
MKLVETIFRSLADLVHFFFHLFDQFLLLLLLQKDAVHLIPLLVILILQNHEEVLHLLRPGVGPLLIQSQIVVRQISLQLPHSGDKLIVTLLESGVHGVVILDALNLLAKAADLLVQCVALLSKHPIVIGPVVNLPPRALRPGLHSRHSLLRHGPFCDLHIRRHAHPHRCLPQSCSLSAVAAWSHCGARRCTGGRSTHPSSWRHRRKASA